MIVKTKNIIKFNRDMALLRNSRELNQKVAI